MILRTSTVPCLLLLALTCFPCGCAATRGWISKRPNSSNAKRVIPPDACADEIVEFVNQQSRTLRGWRCSGAKIRVSQIPVPMSAEIAVDRDRRFRLVINSLMGTEVDLGSNPETFWCWMKEDPQKQIYFASHEEAENVQQDLPFPVDPDWLFEALGTSPLPETHYEMVLHPDQEYASLKTTILAANGTKLTKAIKVDMFRAVVVEHRLIDATGHTVAVAKFHDHRSGPGCKALVAHRIELEWPAAKQKLRIDMPSLELNPQRLPEHLWQMPDLPGVTPVNLATLAVERESSSSRIR